MNAQQLKEVALMLRLPVTCKPQEARRRHDNNSIIHETKD